jgi:hypothetical protein
MLRPGIWAVAVANVTKASIVNSKSDLRLLSGFMVFYSNGFKSKTKIWKFMKLNRSFIIIIIRTYTEEFRRNTEDGEVFTFYKLSAAL